MPTSSAPNWIELEGVVNVRDVGGLPTRDGRRIKPGVLIRSANLLSMTEGDVARLVDELGVRRVLDLRTDVEVNRSGPGRLHQADSVTVHHLSLYPDSPEAAAKPDAVVPWAGERYDGPRDPQVVSYCVIWTGGRIPSSPPCGRSPSRTGRRWCTARPARTGPA